MGSIAEGEARVAAIFPIHLLGEAECPPDWVVNVAEDAIDTELSSILSRFPELDSLNIPESKLYDKELAAEIADRWVQAGRKGYLTKVEIQHRRYQTEEIFAAGWGLFRICWIYSLDLNDLEASIDNLAEILHGAARAEWRAKEGAR